MNNKLFLVIIVICVGVYSYLKAEADKRTRAEDVQYLKKLVDIVNNAKDARWKARNNYFLNKFN